MKDQSWEWDDQGSFIMLFKETCIVSEIEVIQFLFYQFILHSVQLFP